MQHFSVPAHEFSEDAFDEGYGFDGSSIRGFQEIQESDMILLPDPNTAVIDPFRVHKTLNVNCFVRDPVTGDPYSRDPKYVVKNVARQHNLTATFMPKPLFQDNGSGMHTHQSLWKGGEPLFFSETGYAGLSDMARWYIGGLLTHARSILAFAAPTTNSYKRLVPGYEAPVNLVYSQRNRSACVRTPLYSTSPESNRPARR